MQKIGHPQFATITQVQSPKKFHTRHFSIFSLEILNMASKLNLAVNYLLRSLNFDFGAFLAQLKRNFQENFAKKCEKIKEYED